MSISKKLKSIIKNCDCFGTFVTFRINEDNELKSLFGGLATIFYLLIAIIYISYMSYRFIARKELSFINAYRIVESEPFLNLTETEFNFAFGIESEDTENPYVEEGNFFFNYSVYLIEWIGKENISKINIPIKQCTQEDFHHLIDNSFKKSNLSQLFCPNWNNINYTLEGTYMDYYYKYIIIQISLTEYALNNLDLTKKLFIDNPFEMALFFLDNAMDYDNRKKPMPLFLNHIFRTIDFNYVKNTQVLISPVEFYNDENIIIENPHLSKGLTIDSYFDSFRNSNRSNKKDNLVGQFILKASTKIVELKRSYEKLPLFVADLTGILENILIFLLLTVNVIERILIDHKIITKMFKYKGSKYYDIDYLLKTFNNDNNCSNIMKIINKQNLDIVKKGNGGFKSMRKSIISLLENKFANFENNKNEKKNNFISNSDMKFLKISTIDTQNKFNKNDNIKVEVKSKQPDGISLLNYTLKKSENDSYSVESLSSINEDYTNERKNIEEVNSNNEIIYTSPTLRNIMETDNDNEKDNNNNNNNNNLNNNNYRINNNYNCKNKENIFSSGICKIICFKLFSWTNKKLKENNIIFSKAENKIHYYLDIYNYIQKIQEIDLLIYILFDNDQYTLFQYLSKPPIITGNINQNCIYQEFLDKQYNKQLIGKKEIDNLYTAFNKIRKKNEHIFEDLKLLRLVNAEVKYLNNNNI